LEIAKEREVNTLMILSRSMAWPTVERGEAWARLGTGRVLLSLVSLVSLQVKSVSRKCRYDIRQVQYLRRE